MIQSEVVRIISYCLRLQIVGIQDFTELPNRNELPLLVVFDNPVGIPLLSNLLSNLLKKESVHIVILYEHFLNALSLPKEISQKLLRGTNTIDIQPLSNTHATQRIVHSLMRSHHLVPCSGEQNIFQMLAEYTNGSPDIVDIVSVLLKSHFQEANTLQAFADKIKLNVLGSLTKSQLFSESPPERYTPNKDLRYISSEMVESMNTVQESENAWITNTHYDSWQVVAVLIENCKLSPEEKLLLYCLSIFKCCPIPTFLLSEIATIIGKASSNTDIADNLHGMLKNAKFLKLYPKNVIFYPSSAQQRETETDFYYVSHFIAEALWKDVMTEADKVMTLSLVFQAFQAVSLVSHSPTEHSLLLGLCGLLLESFDLHFNIVGKLCYQKVYQFYLTLQ